MFKGGWTSLSSLPGMSVCACVDSAVENCHWTPFLLLSGQAEQDCSITLLLFIFDLKLIYEDSQSD